MKNADVFVIRKMSDGKLNPTSREILIEKINALPVGETKVALQTDITGKYTPTRYKYYFACFLPCVFFEARKDYQIIEGGEHRNPKDPTELHEFIKAEHNRKTVINKNTGEVYVMGMTTTGMSDREFIGTFLEILTEKYINPPYMCDIIFYDDWKEACSEGGIGWQQKKKEIPYYTENV